MSVSHGVKIKKNTWKKYKEHFLLECMINKTQSLKLTFIFLHISMVSIIAPVRSRASHTKQEF